jgi:hypothetical protein
LNKRNERKIRRGREISGEKEYMKTIGGNRKEILDRKT